MTVGGPGSPEVISSHLPGNIIDLSFPGSPGSRGEGVGLIISRHEGKGQCAETSPHTQSPSPLQRSSRAPHRSHRGWAHRYVLAVPNLVMSLNQGSPRHKARGCEDFTEALRNNPVLCPHYIAERAQREVPCLRPYSEFEKKQGEAVSSSPAPHPRPGGKLIDAALGAGQEDPLPVPTLFLHPHCSCSSLGPGAGFPHSGTVVVSLGPH